MKITVAVNGALGNMGREVVRTVHAEAELELVAAIDLSGKTTGDIGEILGLGRLGFRSLLSLLPS